MTSPSRRLEPPDWFDPERRAIWDETVRRLTDAGGLFRADPRVLEVYVCAYVAHTRAAQLAAVTDVLITRDGRDYPNPALTEQRRAAEALAKASKTLGLNTTPLVNVLAESPMSELRRWCEHHTRWECRHNRQDGLPCHSRTVIPGTGSCKKHCGMKIEDARAKGQANLARAYTSPPMDIGPGDVLLWEVQHSAGHVADLRAQVRALAEAEGPDGQPGSGLWYGLARQVTRPGEDGQVVEQEFRAAPHVILRAYDAERDHLVKTAAAAHTAGAQTAAISVARALGQGVHQLFDDYNRALELTEAQWAKVPVVLPAILEAYDPAPEQIGELPGGSAS